MKCALGARNFSELGGCKPPKSPRSVVRQDGGSPRVCQRSAWLMVRAVALHEASTLSLCAVLRKTQLDQHKPPQPRCMLQELILFMRVVLRELPQKHELLALTAAAVCEHRLLSTFCIFEKPGTGYDPGYSGQRRNISASTSSAREDNSRPPERLVGSAVGSGARERPVTAAHCLAQRGEAELDVTALPPRFDFLKNVVLLLTGCWILAAIRREEDLYSRATQLRSERVTRNASEYCSCSDRRSGV